MKKQRSGKELQHKSKPLQVRKDELKSSPKISEVEHRPLYREILLGLLVCVIFFGTIEAVLRITNIPSQQQEDDPYVGFSVLQPLFTVVNGTASTSTSKLKYFNKTTFSAEKQPGSFRVFCFGGSTTYGHPFDGRTAFPRWLGEILAASCPGRRFEVINAGGISYASYRIKPLVKEALSYRPDLMVILTGENEFLEWRTYPKLMEQGRTLVSIRTLLERLHLYRGLEIILQSFLPFVSERKAARNAVVTPSRNPSTGPSASEPSQPQKTVLEDEVTTILDQSAGLETYHRDDAFSQGVYNHFALNIRDMVNMCRKAAVPVFFVEPLSNLKDFSPFKSEHGPNIDKIQATKIDQDIETAGRLIRQGELDKALQLLNISLKTDPLYAITHYLTGKALLGLGRIQEAEASFIRARDLDVCPLRAPSNIIHELHLALKNEGVPLIPFQELITAMPAPGDDGSRIAGNERMLDHVHPTIEGHQLLAEVIFEKIMAQNLLVPTRRLGGKDRNEIYKSVIDKFDRRFFALRDWNLAKTLYWAGKKTEARAAVTRSSDQLEDHPEAHAMLGSFFLDDGEFGRAIAEFEKSVALSGNQSPALYGLAVAYYMSGRKTEAESTLRLFLEKGQAVPDAYCKLALICLESHRASEAMQVLESGLRISPNFPPLLAAYGMALSESGKPDEGIPWMLRALEREPNNVDYLQDLALLYALTGRKEEAAQSLRIAVRNGYGEINKLAENPVFAFLREDGYLRSIIDNFDSVKDRTN